MAKEKILVVDDSATQLIMYKMALTKAGYLVISAKNGVEGVHLVETENPDLIVSDIIMPELNGYQFCRLVKDDPSRGHIPIILLTSLGQQQDRFWGIEAGANSFVTKSTDTAELLAEVDRLIKSFVKPQMIDYSEREDDKYAVSSPENAEESVKTKINRILERLLYESTVSNRMRELSRYAYNRSEMLKKAFELFHQIVEYHASVITLFVKEDVHFTIDIQKPVTDGFVDDCLKTALHQDFNPEKIRLGMAKNVRKEVLQEELVQKDGTAEIQSTLIIPLQDDNEAVGSIAVFTSDTFAYNKDIHKLVQLIARELLLTIKYIRKLEEIERMKTNFTSTIVNDLRGPIIANQSFVDALYHEYVDPVTEDQKEILGNILGNNKKLLSFINDILDISRIESGTLEVFVENNTVKTVLDDAVKNMAILAEQKEILLTNDIEDETIKAVFDAEKIIQVMNNLISNGIKFTSNGGSVSIGVEPDPGGPLRFYVRDTGIGIPEDELPFIFEKYKRGSGVFSSDEHAAGGGVGLGLAICKSIVEAHKGKIWVESKVGEGSVVYFTVQAEK
ncbi:hybrid sensor histidine kinase/response regulator [bacterium]|nr:hybrid sensor histidine kinase/response regulator [bacterium]